MNTRKKTRIRLTAAGAAVAALLAGGMLTAGPASANQVPPQLGENGVLHPGTYLQSHGAQYRLLIQNDGNLVELGNGKVLWSTGTGGHPGAYLKMQTDGNAVVYTSLGKPLWSSQTYNFGPYADNEIGLGSDGNVWVKGDPAGVLWQNGAPGTNVMAGSNTVLEPGWYLHSGSAKLIMQGDGNFVSYVNGKAVWSTGTQGQTTSAKLSSTGALQIVAGATGTGKVLWTTPAAGANARLQVGMDGRLTLFSGSTIVWQS